MQIQKTLLLGAIALSTIAAKAQTASEIVDKYIAAVGGKDKIAGIKTLYTEGAFQVMGTESSSITYIISGKGFKNEVDMNGQKIIQCITTNGGWTINPYLGQKSAQPLPEEVVKQGKSQLDVGGPLFNYTAKGSRLELSGKEDVDNVKNAYKVTLNMADSNSVVYFFDPSTFYIIKSTNKVKANGMNAEVSTIYSDYKKTAYGFVMPYRTEISPSQGFSIVMELKNVEINKEIDPKIFEMPK